MIVAAPMGDPNASIPTPQPVHYQPMFGAFGKARTASSVVFTSKAAITGGLARKLGIDKQLYAVQNTRGRISKKSMVLNDATPNIEVDPETYEVRADGELLSCLLAVLLLLALWFFLFLLSLVWPRGEERPQAVFRTMGRAILREAALRAAPQEEDRAGQARP